MNKKRTRGRKSLFPKRSPLITPFESSFFKTSNTDNCRLKTKLVPIQTHNPKIFNFKTKYAHMTLILKKRTSTLKKLSSSFMPQSGQASCPLYQETIFIIYSSGDFQKYKLIYTHFSFYFSDKQQHTIYTILHFASFYLAVYTYQISKYWSFSFFFIIQNSTVWTYQKLLTQNPVEGYVGFQSTMYSENNASNNSEQLLFHRCIISYCYNTVI